MPKGRKTVKKMSVTNSSSILNDTLISEGDVTLNPMDLNELPPVSLWSMEIEEKFESSINKIDDLAAQEKEKLRIEYETILLKLPQDILNKKVDLNDERLMNAFMALHDDDPDVNDDAEICLTPPVAPSTIKRQTAKRTCRVRSSSADALKTPMNKMRLSEFTSSKKYTVCKPKKVEEDSGIHMKRIMKPNEEAISTSGSPLYVHSGAVSIPHVNIPLPGGKVLNIEPKTPKGPMQVLEIDDRTRAQIKRLCEQLQNIF